MPDDTLKFIRSVARDLRKSGIPVRVSRKTGAVLLFPTLGGEGVAALRMLHPALQNLTIRTGIFPKLPKTKNK